jgi:hypothetical protein
MNNIFEYFIFWVMTELRTKILVLKPEKILPKTTYGVFYYMAVKPGP